MSAAAHQAKAANSAGPDAASRVASALVQRRCACGGKAGPDGECAECRRKRLGLQARLRVQPAGDGYEREAERVAARVLSPVSGPPPAISSLGAAAAQRREGGGGPAVGARTEAAIRGLQSGGGRALGGDVRAALEPGFGHSFADVRVHTGERAAKLADDLGALAFTVGRDVAFARGAFDPGSASGLRLLAHELTHVVQQRGGAETVARAPAGDAPQGPGRAGSSACGGNAICPGVDCQPCGGGTPKVREAKRRVVRLFRRARRRLRRIRRRQEKGRPLRRRAKRREQQFRQQIGAAPLDQIAYETGRADSAQGTTPIAGRAVDRLDSILDTAGEFLRSARVLRRPRQVRGATGNVIVCGAPFQRSCLCGERTFAVYQNSVITICEQFFKPIEAVLTETEESERAKREIEGQEGIEAMGIESNTGGGSPAVTQDRTYVVKSGAAGAETAMISERTAFLAHEAVHHATDRTALDVYRDTRLFSLLRDLGSNTLPPLQLENPDSIVRFVFTIASFGGDLEQFDTRSAKSTPATEFDVGDGAIEDQMRSNLAFAVAWANAGADELGALQEVLSGAGPGETWERIGLRALHTMAALRGETVQGRGGSSHVACAGGSRFDGLLSSPFPCPRGNIGPGVIPPLSAVKRMTDQLHRRLATVAISVHLQDEPVEGGIRVIQVGGFENGKQIPDAELNVGFDLSFTSQPADAQVRGLIVALLIGDKIASQMELAEALAGFLADNAQRLGTLRGGPPTIRTAGEG